MIDRKIQNLFKKITRKLKKWVENATGIQIFYELPFGVSVHYDLSSRLPGLQFKTIFDVGANVGQSTNVFVSTYPSSKIYSFEPIKASYQELSVNMDGKRQVQCFNLALGDYIGEALMCSDEKSTMNYIITACSDNHLDSKETEIVKVTSLDKFCEENNICSINFLKIDAEGADLNVLRGQLTC